MLIRDFDVNFRNVNISTGLGTICGICLSYRNKEGAESFFAHIHQHLPPSGQIPKNLFEVKAIVDANGSYLLVIQVGLRPTMRQIEIKGIDPKYINELRESLKTFKYYLILAGFQADNNQFVLMPMASNHLLVNNIDIDNKEYFGNSDYELAWDELIQSKYVVSVE